MSRIYNPLDVTKICHIDTKQLLYSLHNEESVALVAKDVSSEANRVTTEEVEGIDISRVCTSDEAMYAPVGIGDGSGVNTEVQIIAVNSEENGPMIEGEMIELVIPDDGTDVRNIGAIETSKVEDTNI